jgi:hypothetical protein
MKRTRVFFVMTLAVGLLCTGWAFGIDAFAADRNPCSEDVAQFCGSVSPGPAGMIALMDCLEQHENELPDACRDFEAVMGGPRMERREAVRGIRQFRQNCIDDMARFCKDAGPMEGGMMKCLSDHENELSLPCSQSIKAMR